MSSPTPLLLAPPGRRATTVAAATRSTRRDDGDGDVAWSLLLPRFFGMGGAGWNAGCMARVVRPVRIRPLRYRVFSLPRSRRCCMRVRWRGGLSGGRPGAAAAARYFEAEHRRRLGDVTGPPGGGIGSEVDEVSARWCVDSTRCMHASRRQLVQYSSNATQCRRSCAGPGPILNCGCRGREVQANPARACAAAQPPRGLFQRSQHAHAHACCADLTWNS